jgi:hypothetical protein
VDSEDRLVGIVSRSDLLRPYLRSDEDIRMEINDGVLLGTMWMYPSDFTVTVDQGIVTIRGEVERRSTVPLLVGIIRSVPGVVDVIERVRPYDETPRTSVLPVHRRVTATRPIDAPATRPGHPRRLRFR